MARKRFDHKRFGLLLFIAIVAAGCAGGSQVSIQPTAAMNQCNDSSSLIVPAYVGCYLETGELEGQMMDETAVYESALQNRRSGPLAVQDETATGLDNTVMRSSNFKNSDNSEQPSVTLKDVVSFTALKR